MTNVDSLIYTAASGRALADAAADLAVADPERARALATLDGGTDEQEVVEGVRPEDAGGDAPRREA